MTAVFVAAAAAPPIGLAASPFKLGWHANCSSCLGVLIAGPHPKPQRTWVKRDKTRVGGLRTREKVSLGNGLLFRTWADKELCRARCGKGGSRLPGLCELLLTPYTRHGRQEGKERVQMLGSLRRRFVETCCAM